MTTNKASDYIAAAGSSIANDIQQFMKSMENQRQQADYTKGVMQGLSAPNDKPIGELLKQFIQSGAGSSPEIPKGFLQGVLMRNQLTQQQGKLQLEQDQLGFVPTAADFTRAHTAGYELVPTGNGRYKAVSTGRTSTEPEFVPAPEQIAQGQAVGLKWLPTSRGQGRWVQDPTNPVNLSPEKPGKAAPPDSLAALDKDVHAIAGAPLATFINGQNKRITDGQFLVDAPNAGGTFAMPTEMFDRFRARYDVLNGAPGTEATPVQASGVAPGPVNVAAGQANRVDPAAALSQARAKIQAGGDPAAVRARLQQLGIDPSGL